MIHLAIEGADRTVFKFVMREGKWQRLVVTSPYLVSAGQEITLEAVARVVP